MLAHSSSLSFKLHYPQNKQAQKEAIGDLSLISLYLKSNREEEEEERRGSLRRSNRSELEPEPDGIGAVDHVGREWFSLLPNAIGASHVLLLLSSS